VISHPDKVLFPDDGITKGELAGYYEAIAPVMLPHLTGRPVTMERYPNGIGHKGFLQKDVSKGFPDWLSRIEVPKKGGVVHHPLVRDARSLLWLANQNCITPHVSTARADRLDRPDRIVWDLDPSDDDFALVRRTAVALGDLLREAGTEPFAMVTGSRGIHVVVAIRRRYAYDAVRAAALSIAEALVERQPDDLTTQFYKEKRGGRLFVDVNRNGRAQTAVPPYAVRPRPGAPVATPLRWDELDDAGLRPDGWTLRTVRERLEHHGEPWAAIGRSAGALPRL
jgi:bifunctional non-homologous end joining protein LigD